MPLVAWPVQQLVYFLINYKLLNWISGVIFRGSSGVPVLLPRPPPSDHDHDPGMIDFTVDGLLRGLQCDEIGPPPSDHGIGRIRAVELDQLISARVKTCRHTCIRTYHGTQSSITWSHASQSDPCPSRVNVPTRQDGSRQGIRAQVVDVVRSSSDLECQASVQVSVQ